MNKRKYISFIFVILSLVAVCSVFAYYCLSVRTIDRNRTYTTNVNIKSENPVLTSQLPNDFVDRELAEYKIIGKWRVVGDDGYVIAMKDGQLWSTYYNKKERSVGVLIPLLQRIENGDTIIYSEQSFSGEYMIIRPKGLYLYGNNDLEPYVWPVDR